MFIACMATSCQSDQTWGVHGDGAEFSVVYKTNHECGSRSRAPGKRDAFCKSICLHHGGWEEWRRYEGGRGAHTGHPEYHDDRTLPLKASLSMFGVTVVGWPLNPTSPSVKSRRGEAEEGSPQRKLRCECGGVYCTLGKYSTSFSVTVAAADRALTACDLLGTFNPTRIVDGATRHSNWVCYVGVGIPH
jgi:hypothetical protein